MNEKLENEGVLTVSRQYYRNHMNEVMEMVER